MLVKTLEIRDENTFIAVLAVDMNLTLGESDARRYLLRRCGYPCNGKPNILLTDLNANGYATNDPYHWSNRTMREAHHFITKHWHELTDGDVVDVEFILGETESPKVSERVAA